MRLTRRHLREMILETKEFSILDKFKGLDPWMRGPKETQILWHGLKPEEWTLANAEEIERLLLIEMGDFAPSLAEKLEDQVDGGSRHLVRLMGRVNIGASIQDLKALATHLNLLINRLALAMKRASDDGMGWLEDELQQVVHGVSDLLVSARHMIKLKERREETESFIQSRKGKWPEFERRWYGE